MTTQPCEIDAVPGLREAVRVTAKAALVDAPAQPDAIMAEQWASAIASMWEPDPDPDPLDRERLFGLALVDRLEAAGGDGGLAALRALAAVGSERFGSAARAAAERLRRRGSEDPGWAGEVGAARAMRALTLRIGERSRELVMGVGFSYPSGGGHALVAFVDDGSALKHLGLVPALDDLLLGLTQDGDGVVTEEVDVADAAETLRLALEARRRAPQDGENVPRLLPLAEGRIRRLVRPALCTC